MKPSRFVSTNLLAWFFVASILVSGKALFATELSINPSASTSGMVGNVAVTVMFQSQGAAVSALQFDLEYDRTALTISATAGTSTNSANKTLSSNVLPNGDTRFLIFGLNQTVIGDGPVVNLTIQVNANPSITLYSLGILNAVASSPDAQSVPITALYGSIDITGSNPWQALNSQPFYTFGAAFLLTDGTIMVQDNGPNNNGSGDWWKLTPDETGSYINGSWLQLASMPAGYGPLYYASAVLSDGRLVAIGGEFNSSGTVVQTNQGAIYDPKANNWTSLTAPNGWAQIGDAPSVVLPDGSFLLAHISDSQLALLDPVTLTWSVATSTGKSDPSAGEGLTLLPDGTVLTVNTTASPGAQRYVSSSGQWISAGSTPVSLANGQIGPATLRADGTVFATGANGHNAIYTPPANLTDAGVWAAAPDFPNIAGEGQLDVVGGPACLLPNGNVLVAASPGVFTPPVHFFEFDGTNLTEIARPPNAIQNASNYGHLLLLPNGQVLYIDTLSTAQVYTSSGAPNPAWAPTITLGPTQIDPGATYSISGTQFNGLSQAVAYGSDYQAATNYPLVRITNQATGHVFYARTHDHSTMAVATGTTIVSTNFDVPNIIEPGPSDLVVVANGNPSASLPVTVVTALKSSDTALGSTLNPSVSGQTVTFTATVTSFAGGTPTGTVTFFDGTTGVLGTGGLDGSGIATFTTSSLVIGSHSITAQYGGDSSFSGSTSFPPLSQVVNGKASVMTLISSLNPEVAGESVTFTATVTSTSGGTPTGTVTFFNGLSALGTGPVTLSGSGVATLTTTVLLVGSPSITASYSGDANYAPGVSPVETETVNAAGFAPAPTGLTVTAGQNLPINLTLFAAAGSNFNFMLSCLGAPAKTTCLFGTNPVVPGPPPNGTTVQLTLQTSSSSLPGSPSKHDQWPWGALGIFATLAALLATCVIQSHHAPRRRLALGMCLAAIALASVLISCGGGGTTYSPPSTYTGTPKGPATFTVTGTSGTTTISTQATVTIQ